MDWPGTMMGCHGGGRALVWAAPIVVVALSWIPGAARANGPEVEFFGSAVYPVNSRDIQLVSEVVDIRPGLLGGESSGVRRNATCTYRLRNLSDSTRHLSMAFVLGTPVSDDGEERRVAVDQYAFQVVQDGRPRVVRFAADSLHLFRNEFLAYSDSFPVWELTIPPRAMSTVEMRYFADWDAGCDGGCFQFFRYYARPAALWAGRLERASFRLHLGDDTFVRRLLRPRAPWSASVTPGGFQWTKDGVSWGFEDWKPDSDLVVRVDYAGGDDFCESEPSWNPWTPDSKAAAPAITSGLDRVPEVESRECPDEGDCPWLPTEEWGTWQFHLRAHVTVAGQVDQVRCPEPPSMMAEDRGWGGRGAAAMQCVRRWRFRPAMRAGRIVDAWVDVRLESASHE